jgi:hypothetical protein
MFKVIMAAAIESRSNMVKNVTNARIVKTTKTTLEYEHSISSPRAC